MEGTFKGLRQQRLASRVRVADPLEWTILERVVAVLAAITTGGGYNFDLSGSGQAYIGDPEVPPMVLPCAAVSWVSDEAADGQPLGKYRITSRMEVFVMTTWTDETSSGHTRALLQLVYDVRKALEADRTLNANVYDLIVERVDDASGVTRGAVGPTVVGAVLTVRVWRERNAAAA